MSSAKSVTGLILFAKNEATYNAGATVTGSLNAIQTVLDHPVFQIQYAYDGNRNGASYTAGNYRRNPTQGRSTAGTVRIEAKGTGSAYTIATPPPNIHPFMLASGMSASFEASSYVYKPTPLGTTPTSIALEVYSRGELTPVSGGYATFTAKGDTAGPVVFEFAVQGLAALPSTLASPPGRVWIASGVLPPNNANISLVLGSYTPVVRSWEYDHGLEITPRVNLNSVIANAGFALGRRSPTFKCTIEADTLANYNAYDSHASGTITAISLTAGNITGNKIAVSMPYSQLSDVQQSSDGPVALLDLTFVPSVQNASSDDDVVWTWS